MTRAEAAASERHSRGGASSRQGYIFQKTEYCNGWSGQCYTAIVWYYLIRVHWCLWCRPQRKYFIQFRSSMIRKPAA